MRPPQRSRASRMVTVLPARASSRAAITPAAPAPTIRTWGRSRLDDQGLGWTSSGHRSPGSPAGMLRQLCNKDRNSPGCALLIVRVGWIRRSGKLPEPSSFRLVFDLAHPHGSHHGRITDFNIRTDTQIVHPGGISRCPALRPDEDVAVAVLDAHQWGLADCASLVADMGHDDHRQPCITQGGALSSTAAFVKLDLLAHPVLGA